MLAFLKKIFFSRPILLGRWKVKSQKDALKIQNPDPGYYN